jgi:hypothetical protein
MNTTNTYSLSNLTEEQLDAISSALKDYADYGEEEATIADEIDAKINSIFRITE